MILNDERRWDAHMSVSTIKDECARLLDHIVQMEAAAKLGLGQRLNP